MGLTDLPTSPHLATSDDAVGDATYPIAGRFRLADGRLVRLRPLQADDAPRLMDLCKRLTPSTTRRRFLRSVVRCDPLEAQRLAAVDQVQRVALVAVPDPADDPPIVAVCRFHGNDVHLYLAESDRQKRQEWIGALDTIESLHPEVVVAGHKRAGRADDPRIVEEARQYIRDFDRIAETTNTRRELYDQAGDGARLGPARPAGADAGRHRRSRPG